MLRRVRPSRPVRRLLSLSMRELTDLGVAQLYLCAAWWTVRRRTTGQLLRLAGTGRTSNVRMRDDDWVIRIANAVDRVSRFGVFRPTCLVRSIALEHLIRHARGGALVLKVGVLRRGDALLAHAWIELGDRVIGDEPSFVRQFTPLNDFSALSR